MECYVLEFISSFSFIPYFLGSGKTFTMEGPEDKTDNAGLGMIPRAVQQIFQTAAELEDKGWQYEFEASFLEIYNETIRDLLGSGKENVKHDIKMVQQGSSEVTVSNMTLSKVTEQDQVGFCGKIFLLRVFHHLQRISQNV